MFKKFFILSAILCFYGSLEAITWHRDFLEAVEKAKKDSKPLFILFTANGCHYCKKSDDEIFNTKDFEAAVGHKLIFVRMDYSQEERGTIEEKRARDKLAERYSLEGIPTVLILTPDEKVIARMGYATGGGKKYAQNVMDILNDTYKR